MSRVAPIRRARHLAGALLVAATVAPAAAGAAAPEAVPGEAVVGLERGRTVVVDDAPAEAKRRLASDEDVRFVEPNYVVRASAAPADPRYAEQWALDAGAALGAPLAWDRSSGEGVIVAVVDTGIDFGHPDLPGAVWRNPREVPNGVDDDANGVVDDLHGLNVFNGSGNVQDDEGHGTHVAGMIAARANNGVGGAGLAPAVQIMPIKVLDANRAGTAAGLAAGIRYAVAQGAQIINASLNGDGRSQALEDAVAAAEAAGVVVVASAGNDGRNIDAAPSYPAAYPQASILAVSAEDEGGARPSFANYGPANVDVAAPGLRIFSTAVGGSYELRSGTSMSAAYVSGAAALVKAVRPDLDGLALRDVLMASARRTAALSGVVGAGSVTASGALSHAAGPCCADAGDAAAATAQRSVARSVAATGVMHPAKLAVSRSRVLRDDRMLDVFAPITGRAAGRLEVSFHAAGRTARFTERVDAANRRVRVRERLSRAQARKGTGILTLRYRGDDDTRPQEVRLRAARGKARLSAGRPLIVDGRLRTSGRITRKARGVVRVQLDWIEGGQTRSAELDARISNGRWTLDEELPADTLRSIEQRTSTLHSYILFTGYLPERLRGEMRSYQVLDAR